MRLMLALLTLGCASSPPPRPATEIAVGSEEWNEVRLREWILQVPAEALGHVQIVWREGERSAELSLTGASIGSSVERMADQEASAMRSLEPDLEITRRRLRVAGVVAIGLTQGEKDVVVAMRNPWRALRLAVRGGSADEWLGSGSASGSASVAGVALRPQWELESARFECDAWALIVARDGSITVREKTGAPEDLERIRRSLRR